MRGVTAKNMPKPVSEAFKPAPALTLMSVLEVTKSSMGDLSLKIGALEKILSPVVCTAALDPCELFDEFPMDSSHSVRDLSLVNEQIANLLCRVQSLICALRI